METKMEVCPPDAAESKFYSYPAHKLLGVFNDPEKVKASLDDLKESGFHEHDVEVICNAGQIDFSGEKHGVLGRIVRSLQHLSAEGRYLDRYEQDMKDGRLLLAVVAKDAETKEKVKDILQAHGGYRLTYFGNWLIEGMPDVTKTEFDTHPYGYRRELHLPFEESLLQTREALQSEGFGVLCEIDMKEKLREKLGVDFRNYVILGACNPPLAHSALQQDLDIGLLLPCNVIVYEWNSGSVVAAIDAKKMMSVTGNPNLETTAQTVNEKLQRAIESI
jgi:uncharacterized protein (DUF302 family)